MRFQVGCSKGRKVDLAVQLADKVDARGRTYKKRAEETRRRTLRRRLLPQEKVDARGRTYKKRAEETRRTTLRRRLLRQQVEQFAAGQPVTILAIPVGRPGRPRKNAGGQQHAQPLGASQHQPQQIAQPSCRAQPQAIVQTSCRDQPQATAQTSCRDQPQPVAQLSCSGQPQPVAQSSCHAGHAQEPTTPPRRRGRATTPLARAAAAAIGLDEGNDARASKNDIDRSIVSRAPVSLSQLRHVLETDRSDPWELVTELRELVEKLVVENLKYNRQNDILKELLPGNKQRIFLQQWVEAERQIVGRVGRRRVQLKIM